MTAEKLKDADVPAVVNVSEFMRRMSEMNSFYMMGDSAADVTLVVNLSSPAVQALKGADEEAQKLSVMQIYYLAMLAYKQLSPEELAEYTRNQNELIKKYLGN